MVFFNKVDFEKKLTQDNQKAWKITQGSMPMF